MEGIKKGIKLLDIEESNALFASTSEEAKEIQEISDKICELINQLRTTREGKGMTQRQFADVLNWKQPALARIESLDVVPKLDTFLKITNKLGGNVYIEFFDNDIPTECLKSGTYVNYINSSSNQYRSLMELGEKVKCPKQQINNSQLGLS